MQSFARGGCGLPAQSVESTGCHLERSVADAKSKGLDMEKHSPLRFARGHADPAVGIPRLRFATLGMTEQCTIHNYSARSFCHLERSVSGVERSRHNRTFILAKHPRCSQPTKDETFECSPSPGVAADCRRRASNRPAVTLSEASQTRSRKVSTWRSIRPCGLHGVTLIRPSGSLGFASLHSG